MSLISNRKRPRGFSESFAKQDATTPTRTHAETASLHSSQHHLLGLEFDSNISSSSSSSSSSASDRKITSINFNDSIVIEDSESSSDEHRILEDANGEVVDDDDDDDDVIILEERNIVGSSHRSDSIVFLNNDEEESAYNMFNVHNVNANANYNYSSIKKQRTSSLPQLPQVRCFYNRILPHVVQKVPKLGNIRPPVIPCTERDGISGRNGSISSIGSNGIVDTLPTCDDKEGHFIINIGESFADGRFLIVRLLGQGTFGKVIECIDRYNNEKVAIKIIRNIPKYRDAAKIELRILSTLKKFDNDNLNHCIHLKECFDYRGHICIVTDLLKISLYDFLEKNKFISFPGSHIQAISKQLIRSITFLHDLNLIHTDLKPENILLYDDSFNKKSLISHTIRSSYAQLKKNKIKKFPKFLKVLNDPSIQIIDFGSAIFNDEYHSSIVSTRHYRAPEIILGTGWSFPCDLWSIGCILVELIIGEPLFKTHDNIEHLAMIEKICGYQIDTEMVELSKSFQNECGVKYFDSDFELEFYDNVDTPSKFLDSVDKLDRIDLFISCKLGLSIDFDYSLNENYEKNKHLINFGNFTFWWFLIDLLRKLFVINPAKRMSAWDALQHPWFNLGIDDEGTTD
ncbi:dual specificity protein kinase Kns1p [[Candida] railenensis]|uniref:Dual specificity protein kinase Kns1p n=1 Tax=[Candida] railenensis TaxID=45579 RepID=A0A9P0QWE8_9ASCO|nr:dual specificity protein kinase Kns1p [[Candida] railenensis]